MLFGTSLLTLPEAKHNLISQNTIQGISACLCVCVYEYVCVYMCVCKPIVCFTEYRGLLYNHRGWATDAVCFIRDMPWLSLSSLNGTILYTTATLIWCVELAPPDYTGRDTFRQKQTCRHTTVFLFIIHPTPQSIIHKPTLKLCLWYLTQLLGLLFEYRSYLFQCCHATVSDDASSVKQSHLTLPSSCLGLSCFRMHIIS